MQHLPCYRQITPSLDREGREEAEWLYLNRQLTIIQNADPAICNLARSMRLPGMVRRRVVDGILSATIPITLVVCQVNFARLNSDINAAFFGEHLWFGNPNRHWLFADYVVSPKRQ